MNKYPGIARYEQYFLLVYLTLLLIYAPIFRGLYFTAQWYPLQVASLILFVLWLFLRTLQKENFFFKTPLDYAVVALVCSYLIALPGAVYPFAAYSEFFKAATLLTIYFFVLTLTKDSATRASAAFYILQILLFAGALVTLIGLAAASGALEAPGLLVREGLRIQSTLQYHNALAIYLGALYIIALGLYTRQENWLSRLPYLLLGLFFIITVIFTSSRGAWLVLAFCLLLYLILSLRGYRPAGIIFVLITFLLALFSVPLLEHYFAARASTSVVLYLSALALVAAGLSFLIHLFLPRLARLAGNHKTTAALLMVALISLALLSLPVNAKELYLDGRPAVVNIYRRLTDISFDAKSVAERAVYYRTALNIARDYPVRGAGGGAWEMLYEDYLDVSAAGVRATREPHSHYLKVLLETGLPGLLSFAAIWAFFIAAFVKMRFAPKAAPAEKQEMLMYFSAALALGLHGAVDFSLSLGAVSILLFILFALGRSAAALEP